MATVGQAVAGVIDIEWSDVDCVCVADRRGVARWRLWGRPWLGSSILSGVMLIVFVLQTGEE